jgi:hypothetical protein
MRCRSERNDALSVRTYSWPLWIDRWRHGSHGSAKVAHFLAATDTGFLGRAFDQRRRRPQLRQGANILDLQAAQLLLPAGRAPLDRARAATFASEDVEKTFSRYNTHRRASRACFRWRYLSGVEEEGGYFYVTLRNDSSFHKERE